MRYHYDIVLKRWLPILEEFYEFYTKSLLAIGLKKGKRWDMESNEILAVFRQKGKLKDGDSLAAVLISKEIGRSLEEIYEATLSLQLKGLVEIKSLVLGRDGIGGDPKTIRGFHIELTEEGSSFCS